MPDEQVTNIVDRLIQNAEGSMDEPPEWPPIGLPMHYQFQQLQLQDGTSAICVVITNPIGTWKFLMEANGATQFFEQGLKVAKMSQSGLFIPG